MTLSATALVTLVQAKAHLRVDAASSLHVDAEFVGVGTGSVVEFDLDHTPVEGSLKLYVNNVLQVEDTDFTIAAATITFTTAPTLNHGITANYDYAAGAGTFESYDDDILERLIEAATQKAESYTGRAFIQRSITEQHMGDGTKVLKLYRQPVTVVVSVRLYHAEQVAEGDGSIVAFTLDNTPVTGSVEVYKNGVLQTISVDYTISGITITFVIAPADGARISANYTEAMRDYTERLNIGRLNRELLWVKDYVYQVVYTAGYGANRAATQVLIPDMVSAVLLILANLYENRVDLLKSENIAGVGSVTYDIPSQAKELMNPYRTMML